MKPVRILTHAEAEQQLEHKPREGDRHLKNSTARHENRIERLAWRLALRKEEW